MGRPRRNEAGFTLLEVMIALAIMGISLTALTRSQLNSVRAANRAKMMTVATLLARYKMVEIEDDLFDEGFSDFKEEEKGDFKDEGLERFTYTLIVDKVELPQNLSPEGLADAVSGMADDVMGGGATGKESSTEQTGGLASLGASMLGKQMEMIRNVLEQAIRRVELKVEWKEGKSKKHVSVVAFFTDPRKIDAAAGGGLMPGGAGGIPGLPGAGTGLSAPRGFTPGATPAPAPARR